MRRFCLILVSLLLLASCALAAPRYPDAAGQVVDAAAVLAKSTTDDLSALSKALSKADTADLYVATVDFLDGETLASYGEGLRRHWELEDEDLLLLLAVGEDKYGFFGGEDVNARLSPTVQSKLLSAHLAPLFLQQRYDEALAALMPELVREINKGYDADVSVSGLFGVVQAEKTPDWIVRLSDQTGAEKVEPDLHRRVTQEDEETGLSLGKVILTVALLMILLGNHGKRRGRRGCGCGCAPFSSLLAALGLWKLWGNDR